MWTNAHRTVTSLTCLAVVGLCLLLTASAMGNNQAGDTEKGKEPATDLMSLSIEELMNIEITLASRKPEPWFDTAAAVYVITDDDIRRSGATNIPEALRLVPGLDVAQISGDEWAVSSRGFNGEYANKLLVQIDGRTVYTPVFSGVYWDVQDVVMEDIDRIEVIRGPGATMWGANAVNGIINIVTKSASDTQGTLISETAGSVIQNISVIRHAAKEGNNTRYRVFGKYLKQNPYKALAGGDSNDSYNIQHGGFRADWDASKADSVTFQGDIYSGGSNETLLLPFLTDPMQRPVPKNTPVSGGNLLGRWSRTCSENSDFSLQAYYDHTNRSRAAYGEMVDTLDLEFQHHLKPDARHDIIWGIGYRYIADKMRNTFFISYTPADFDQRIISAFAQGEIVLRPDKLRLTIGSKIEHNDFTDYEIQPSIRFLWTPDQQHTGWAAVSRAVRTPSVGEETAWQSAGVFPDPFAPILFAVIGDRGFKSEDLLAYELGYRIRRDERFSLDMTAFYNIYGKLLTTEVGTPYFDPLPVPHIVMPLFMRNGGSGHTYGFEMAANWRPRDWWRMVAGYTYLRMNLNMSAFDADYLLNNPPNQFFLKSSMDLSKKTEFDCILRYADKLSKQPVPSYWSLDLRLAYKPQDNLEVSLMGRDLLSSKHLEFIPSITSVLPTEVPRSFYGKVAWSF